MEITKIGVVGAGPLAAGVAQLCVQSGLEALLAGETEEELGKDEDAILRGLHRAEQPAAFSLLRKTTDLRALRDCDFVIESAAAGLDVKKDLFRRIDAQLAPRCVLAANTGVLPVSLLASAVENPQRVVGLHFFSPPPIAALVEIIRCAQSSDKTMHVAAQLAARLGKTVVRCKDGPGFIVGRVSRPFFLVGMRLLEQGRGTPAQIDAALREIGGMRIGPLELADLVGLEEDMAASSAIYDLSGRPERLKPCAVEEKLLARGCRGRKNSRGFYVYGENPPGTMNPSLEEIVPGLGRRPYPGSELCRWVLQGVEEEARLAEREGVASAHDIDTAMRLGMGWSRGPFEGGKKSGGASS